jgi:hypothetical protein
MRHEEKDIASISDLIGKLDAHKVGSEILWFRGHSDNSWKLTPSIARDGADPVNREWALFKRFKQNASRFIQGQVLQTNWEWFFLMQHYGVPTRLLDWSENPLVALYFCVSNPNLDGKDANLWALSPVNYNTGAGVTSSYKKDIPCFDLDKELDGYQTGNVLGSTSSLNPIACIAPKNSTRMAAQYGVFTIFHSEFKPLEETADAQAIWKYRIPSGSKPSLRKDLGLLGYSKLSMFPEIGNIADYLKEYFE